MIFRGFCALLLSLGIFLGGATTPGWAEEAAVRDYIDIDSPHFQKFPLAVTPFYALGPSPEGTELSRWFSASLTEMLAITNYFQLILPAAFLEDPAQADSTLQGTHFPDWRAIGAEYLVKGGYRVRGQELTAEFRLFDVVRGEVIRDKRYAGTLAERPRSRSSPGSPIRADRRRGRVRYENRLHPEVRARGGDSHRQLRRFDLTRFTQWKTLTLSPRWSPGGRYLTYTPPTVTAIRPYVQGYPGERKIAAFPA